MLAAAATTGSNQRTRSGPYPYSNDCAISPIDLGADKAAERCADDCAGQHFTVSVTSPG